MSDENFFLFSVVEGDSEVKSLPKLLHKVWGQAHHLQLRTDQDPYYVPKDAFLNKKEKRENILGIVSYYARKAGGNSGVLILMDADEKCCKDLLQSEKVQETHADIERILCDIPYVFVMIERKYESWFAVGLGGKDSAEKFLSECLGKTYDKMEDQVSLIGKMDIEQAAKNNPSFRRFQERILAWRDSDK